MTPDEKATIERGLASSSVHERWTAASVLGDRVDAEPDAVWAVLSEYCSAHVDDTRTALALCVLEPLLARHFALIFPRVQELSGRDPGFAKVFLRCRKCGFANLAENGGAFDALGEKLRAGSPSSSSGELLGPRLQRWNRAGVGVGVFLVLQAVAIPVMQIAPPGPWALGMLGITQCLYVGPAAFLAEAVGLSRVAHGLLVSCIATFLLWAVACAATFIALSRNLS